MHVHFLLKTRELARCGDYGVYITASEWLDVNYGSLVRKLLAGDLGGISIHVVAATAMPFAPTATTGAVFNFCVGATAARMRFRSVSALGSLASLGGGTSIRRTHVTRSNRWSEFLRSSSPRPTGSVELGELVRVHRGQVTGCNRAWIAGAYPGPLPGDLLRSTVTRARDLFAVAPTLRDAANLRRVIDLPVDLDELDETMKIQVDRFLMWARSMRAHESYIARHRRAWWAVSLGPPAPILCTYMARRPPAFVRNLCGARHLNIAHGLYPREPLTTSMLDALTLWLQNNVNLSLGRTYAGGLTKFEPREVERILIPPPDELHDGTATMDATRVNQGCRGGEGFVSALAVD